MKLKCLLLAVISALLTACTKDPQIQAAYDLIERVTPGYSDQFKLELIEPVEGMDAYEISSDGDKVVLKGNNPVAIATAFNQYLFPGWETAWIYQKSYRCPQRQSRIPSMESTEYI